MGREGSFGIFAQKKNISRSQRPAGKGKIVFLLIGLWSAIHGHGILGQKI
jgi:hypothetical protein